MSATLTAKNTLSKRNCLRPFIRAFSGLEHIVWLGDSMSTINGGAGMYRGHLFAQWLARTYGAMPKTPMYFGRPTEFQVSIGGGFSNILNNGSRVTTSPQLPANANTLARPMGAFASSLGLVSWYDPRCVAVTYGGNWTLRLPDLDEFRSVILMPTSTANIRARVYLCTRPSAGTFDVYARSYNVESDAISIGGYSLLTSNVNASQAAAEGNIVSALITPASVTLGETQLYAIQLATSNTTTDVVGVRWENISATSGMSFDMYGEGGLDSGEYNTAHAGAFPAIDKIGRPTLYVMAFGMNDALTYNAGASSYYVTNMTALIASARAVHPTVPIILLLPPRIADAAFNSAIDALATAAASVAQAHDDVMVVDARNDYYNASSFVAANENVTGSTAWAIGQTISVGDLRVYRDRIWESRRAHTTDALTAPPYAYWVERRRNTADGIHLSAFGEAVYLDVHFNGLMAAAVVEFASLGTPQARTTFIGHFEPGATIADVFTALGSTDFTAATYTITVYRDGAASGSAATQGTKTTTRIPYTYTLPGSFVSGDTGRIELTNAGGDVLAVHRFGVQVVTAEVGEVQAAAFWQYATRTLTSYPPALEIATPSPGVGMFIPGARLEQTPSAYRGSTYAGTTIVLLARVVGVDGDWIQQSDITGASSVVVNLQNSTDTTTVSHTVADVVYNTLQTDGRWTEDGIGYNVAVTVSGTRIASAGTAYRVTLTLTTAAGPIVTRWEVQT